MKKELEFENERTEYRSERKVIVRNFNPEEIIKFISKETGINEIMFYAKNNKNTRIAKALASLLMKSLCNYSCKDICNVLGNIIQSTVSRLCCMSVRIISTEDKYKNLINKFISEYSTHKVVEYT